MRFYKLTKHFVKLFFVDELDVYISLTNWTVVASQIVIYNDMMMRKYTPEGTLKSQRAT